MNKLDAVKKIRSFLKESKYSIGSWIQIPNASYAEIIGMAGYDWVAVDMEHGSISVNQLPDLFRALELGETLPFVRVANGDPRLCKEALEAGAAGVIIPMVKNASDLANLIKECSWPPAGTRGVGFSRANLFGGRFEGYKSEAQSPIIVAMIESIQAVENLDEILQVTGLDAILIGPYDLSASMSMVGQFESKQFKLIMKQVMIKCKKYSIPSGIHVVSPSTDELKMRIEEGHQFIAYSLDSVFFRESTICPLEMNIR